MDATAYTIVFVFLVATILVLAIFLIRARTISIQRTEEILTLRALWLREKAAQGDILAQRKVAKMRHNITSADIKWANKFLNENMRK